MKNRIQIYTDGACSNNQLTQNTGGYRNTTNNRMELKAAIEALKTVPVSLPVIVYSDSQYVVKGITEWIHNWIKKGKIAKNGDL